MKVFSSRKLDEILNDPAINASGIAEKAGITPQALSNIRRGRRRPLADTAAAIAFALKKPMDTLYEEKSTSPGRQKLALTDKAVGHG